MKNETIRSLLNDPVLLMPSAHAVLLKAIADNSPTESFWAGEAAGLEVDDDGIAYIPISGPIGRNINGLERMFGLCDSLDIWRDIDAAEKDEAVVAIVLDIDSPGGIVAGIPELGDRIAAVEKPIVAFTGGLACSAAYWLAASADQIFASRSATVGSIGVYTVFTDLSRMAENQGVKVDVISSGKFKGMGVPGTSLTEAQRAMMQDRIKQIADMFKSHVQGMRGDVAEEDMEGQPFLAMEAKQRGLIDEIMPSREDAAALLR